MIGAVVGLGPRVGTSFVMHQLTEAGLPTFWSGENNPTKGSPYGEYETDREELPYLDQKVVKVWPGGHRHCFIERAVVLHRDLDEQIESVARQQQREPGYLHCDPKDIILASYLAAIDFYPELVMFCQTKDINRKMDDIIAFFRGMYKCQSPPPLVQ